MSEKINSSFTLYTYQLKAIELLTMEERGMLITAIFDYVENGTLPNLTPLLNMAFLFFKSQLDTDKSYHPVYSIFTMVREELHLY